MPRRPRVPIPKPRRRKKLKANTRPGSMKKIPTAKIALPPSGGRKGRKKRARRIRPTKDVWA